MLILKLGERGIITYRAPSHEVRSFFTVDSFADTWSMPSAPATRCWPMPRWRLAATGESGDCLDPGVHGGRRRLRARWQHTGDAAQVLNKIKAVEKRVQYA